MQGILKKNLENKRLFIGDSSQQFFGFFRENIVEWRSDDSSGNRKNEKDQDHCQKDGHSPYEIGEYHPVPRVSLWYIVHNYGVEKGKPPIDGYAQGHNIDQKRHKDILEQHRVTFNEFSGPERIKKSPGKIGDRIIFQTECHEYYCFCELYTSSLVGILSVQGTQLWHRPQA